MNNTEQWRIQSDFNDGSGYTPAGLMSRPRHEYRAEIDGRVRHRGENVGMAAFIRDCLRQRLEDAMRRPESVHVVIRLPDGPQMRDSVKQAIIDEFVTEASFMTVGFAK